MKFFSAFYIFGQQNTKNSVNRLSEHTCICNNNNNDSNNINNIINITI